MCRMVRVLLRCDRGAPRRAREAVRLLDGMGPMREDAVLVTTELVANAVLHSGGCPDDEIEVCASIVQDGVRIEVADGGRSGGEPQIRATDPLNGDGGMGLRVVDGLARRWGVDRRDRLLVWAELPA